MLEEDTSLNSDSKFADAITKYCHDERWRAVEERDREELFENYLDDLYKKENEEKRTNRENKIAIFKKVLQEKGISTKTKWKEILFNLKDDPLFNSMEKIDRLQAFIDTVTELEKQEKEEKENKKRYLEYRNRENFRIFLQEKVEKNEINSKTKWKKFVKEIKDAPQYVDLIGQEGSSPRDLFNDVLEILKEDYKRNKEILKKILKANSIKFSVETKFEEFEEKLKPFDEFNSMRQEIKLTLFQNLIKKLKEKVEVHQKRERKIAKKIYSYVQRGKLSFNASMKFEDNIAIIRTQPKLAPLQEESLRNAFELLKDMLAKNPNMENGNTSEESGQIKKKKKAKKTKKHHKEKEKIEKVKLNEEKEKPSVVKEINEYSVVANLDINSIMDNNKKVEDSKPIAQMAEEKEDGETSD
jgi:pre-mRNA-processing factor 40